MHAIEWIAGGAVIIAAAVGYTAFRLLKAGGHLVRRGVDKAEHKGTQL